MGILEHRFQELGRIRIGDQVPVKGKNSTRPRKLDAFRLTSQNKPRLHYAAKLWGGEVTEWPEAPMGKQWQLYTTTDQLPVVVPPFHALSQFNEIWQGGECRLRCNGDTITFAVKADKINQPCYCASLPLHERLDKAKEGQACHAITRLSLILPDVPGVGVWRFETGSFYAGMELQGGALLLEQASAEGAYIECTLQLEERRVRRRNTSGQVQTQVFPVVTLQPHVTMRELMARSFSEHALLGAGPRHPVSTKAPQAVADLWGDDELPDPSLPRLTEAANTPVSLFDDLPDDGWRIRVREGLTLLPAEHPYRAECMKALADAQVSPGHGDHIAANLSAIIDGLQEGAI